jgi:hypothetical protein
LPTIHRHGRQVEVLYLTAERSATLDRQTSKFVPCIGIPASERGRLDTQSQLPMPHVPL